MFLLVRDERERSLGLAKINLVKVDKVLHFKASKEQEPLLPE